MDLRIVIALFIFSSALFAANAPIAEIDSKIRGEKINISSLADRLSNIEKSLEGKNKRYQTTIELCRTLRLQLDQASVILNKNEAELNHLTKEAKGALSRLLVSALDPVDDIQILVEKKLFKEKLQARLLEIERRRNENTESKLQVSELALRLNEYVEIEQDLFSTVSKLEQERANLSSTLASAKSVYSELERQAILKKQAALRPSSTLKLSEVRNDLLSTRFSSPIRSHESREHQKKGITYKFKSVSPVYAPSSGTVIYLGSLSTYGEVMMIDHGHDVRSVLLGDCQYKLRQGDKVQEGDLIGYTKDLQGLVGKLYFEVRRKNIVQNTFTLLR